VRNDEKKVKDRLKAIRGAFWEHTSIQGNDSSSHLRIGSGSGRSTTTIAVIVAAATAVVIILIAAPVDLRTIMRTKLNCLPDHTHFDHLHGYHNAYDNKDNEDDKEADPTLFPSTTSRHDGRLSVL
jgi:hypothetical protein